jgi:prolyl 4-hydroxylase
MCTNETVRPSEREKRLAMLIQQITPEILQWISRQAQAGYTADAVLAAMRASGWSETAAQSAIDLATSGTLTEPPPAICVPEPAISDTPCVVRTSDRDVTVLAALKLPRVVMFGSVLSEAECDELVELARARLQRSRTIDSWSGGRKVSESRTSEGAYFQLGEYGLLRRIEQRIAELLRWPATHGESMQVLRYAPGAEYRPHHDYFEPNAPGATAVLRRGGPRVATLLMYLKSPAKGGATTFPDVGFEVAPIKGNAVFFSYDRPHPVTRTRHGGAPVIEGEKWVATKWLRADVFIA